MSKDRFYKAGIAFEKLCRTMAILRAPNGCEWDQKQTFQSLEPYLLEEAYEVLDAIDKNDNKGHCEELGDLLLQIIFQAEIANETSLFYMNDIIETIDKKLKEEHPHIFFPQRNDSRSWEEIISSRGDKNKNYFDSVPRVMPSLLRAFKSSQKASLVGFDWKHIEDIIKKVEEEWNEFSTELHKSDTQENTAFLDEEMGDFLFTITNLCRKLDIDPEGSLNRAVEKFQKRFCFIEKELEKNQQKISELSEKDLDIWWEKAKKHYSHISDDKTHS